MRKAKHDQAQYVASCGIGRKYHLSNQVKFKPKTTISAYLYATVAVDRSTVLVTIWVGLKVQWQKTWPFVELVVQTTFTSLRVVSQLIACSAHCCPAARRLTHHDWRGSIAFSTRNGFVAKCNSLRDLRVYVSLRN